MKICVKVSRKTYSHFLAMRLDAYILSILYVSTKTSCTRMRFKYQEKHQCCFEWISELEHIYESGCYLPTINTSVSESCHTQTQPHTFCRFLFKWKRTWQSNLGAQKLDGVCFWWWLGRDDGQGTHTIILRFWLYSTLKLNQGHGKPFPTEL